MTDVDAKEDKGSRGGAALGIAVAVLLIVCAVLEILAGLPQGPEHYQPDSAASDRSP